MKTKIVNGGVLSEKPQKNGTHGIRMTLKKTSGKQGLMLMFSICLPSYNNTMHTIFKQTNVFVFLMFFFWFYMQCNNKKIVFFFTLSICYFRALQESILWN
jgi:hypothetical protein